MPASPRRRGCVARGRHRLLHGAVAVTVAGTLWSLATATAAAATAPPWTGRLHEALANVDARHTADIGVYVRDLDSEAAFSWRADESWYLASTVKLPIAITVLRGVERGEYSLATRLPLGAGDYVDGAGQTNGHAPGALLSVRYLLEQMMVYSDNTASDLLIGLVGLRSVNALLQSLVPQGFQPITTLAEVRRQVYSQLAPAASRLAGRDFLLLKQQRSDLARRQALARLLQVPLAEFRLPSLAQAYDAYYASGLNAGRLDAYGELLALLATGKALGRTQTAYLLDVMDRARTGTQRIKAGLPGSLRFAHKTGTQSGRTCDAGIVTVPRIGPDQRVVVVACTRGEASLSEAERALRQVGSALCHAGLFSSPSPHANHCPPDPLPARLLPDPGSAAAAEP